MVLTWLPLIWGIIVTRFPMLLYCFASFCARLFLKSRRSYQIQEDHSFNVLVSRSLAIICQNFGPLLWVLLVILYYLTWFKF